MPISPFLRNIKLIVVISLCISHTFGNTKVVTTSLGKINGTSVTIGNTTVYQYRKIPFAKAPVGELRLRKPVPFGKWQKTLDGTLFGPSCMQVIASYKHDVMSNSNVSEDCLFLNVYIPEDKTDVNKKTVMIWIHGGAFLSGQGTLFDASYIAASGNVVVVTINYRLGALGFLSTGDDASLGNYGLWDQKLAIQWVHENIVAFGGDPNSITLFGESAGGMSIGFQSINPSNKKLFRRIIAESGTAISMVSYAKKPEVFSKLLFNNLNCSNSNYTTNSDKIKCLRSRSASDVLNADLHARAQIPLSIGQYLGPVVDGDFIKDDPIKLLRKQDSDSLKFFRSLDYMTGTVSSEGSLVLYFTGPNLQKIFSFSLKDSIPTRALCGTNGLAFLLVRENFNGNRNIQNAICEKYKSTTNKQEQSRMVVKFYGDALFVAPAVETLDIHSLRNNDSSTYQYLFSRVKSKTDIKWFQGAQHAAELFYLFGRGDNQTINRLTQLSPTDASLSKAIQLYWTNFAKTGNPNNIASTLPDWSEYTDGTNISSYLQLDTNITSQHNLSEDNVNFWLETVQHIPAETNRGNKWTINIMCSMLTLVMCTLGVILECVVW